LLRDTCYNKGNSLFILGQFAEAYDCFERADESGRREAKLAMGNSALLQMKFDVAVDCYRVGVDRGVGRPAENCLTNLNSLEGLLKVIGNERDLSHKMVERTPEVGRSLEITVRNGHKSPPFVFAGNFGNVGNWGGGKGYSGLNRFKAIIKNEGH